MNPIITHSVAGAGGVVAGTQVAADLATALTGFHGLDATHAGAIARLVVYGLSVVATVVVAWWNQEQAAEPTKASEPRTGGLPL